MEAIALMAAVDGLYNLAGLAICLTAAAWVAWHLAPYMDAHKPYQGDEDDYL